TSSSLMAMANILRNEVEKSQKQNLRNSLNRLMINTLKVVCREESLSKKGIKKDLVENVGKMIIDFNDKKGLQDNNFKNRPFGNTDRIRYRGSDRVRFRGYEASTRQTAKSKRQRLDKPIISELAFSSSPIDAGEYRKYTVKGNKAEKEKSSRESTSRVISKVLEKEDKICSIGVSSVRAKEIERVRCSKTSSCRGEKTRHLIGDKSGLFCTKERFSRDSRRQALESLERISRSEETSVSFSLSTSTIQSSAVVNFSGMEISTLVANVFRSTEVSSKVITSSRDYYFRTIRIERTMQKPNIEVASYE
ncbi:9750_t:CDS:2, partial [Scutellospora calospora]